MLNAPPMVMYSLLLIFVVAVAHGVAAGYSPSIKRTNNAGAVRDYLEKVLPTSKDVLLHELMGPKIGADVSYSPSLCSQSGRNDFFFVSLVSSSPQSPIPSSQHSRRTGSETVAVSILPGSMSSPCPAQAKTPAFYEHK